jgi:hypothetical protein
MYTGTFLDAPGSICRSVLKGEIFSVLVLDTGAAVVVLVEVAAAANGWISNILNPSSMAVALRIFDKCNFNILFMCLITLMVPNMSLIAKPV